MKKDRPMVDFHNNLKPLEPFMVVAWREFARKTIPDLQAGNRQYDDLQATFYAGAMQILELSAHLADEDDEFADQALSETHTHVIEFFEQMLKRKHTDE